MGVGMKIRGLVVAVAICHLLVGEAKAALVTWGYSGTIYADVGGEYHVGDRVDGWLTFDTAAIPVISSGGTQADYATALRAMSFGSYVMTLGGPVQTGEQVTIKDNYIPFNPATRIDSGVLGLTEFVAGGGFNSMYFSYGVELNMMNPTAITSLAIPTTPIDPALFMYSGVTFTSSGASPDSPFFYYGINVDRTFAVSAVPEPSTWAMMLIGFAGIGYAAYRRRASRQAAAA